MRRTLGARYLGAILLGVLAGGMLWVGLFFAQLGMPTEQSRWAHEAFQAKARFAAAFEGPRILVVGGSASFFGVRARRLTEMLGVPAVNLAVFAGLDLDYVLHQAKAVARRGDLVVLSLEYEFYGRDPARISSIFMDHLMARDVDYLRRLPTESVLRAALQVDRKRLLKPWTERMEGTRIAYPMQVYYGDHMDAHGDTWGNNPALESPVHRRLVAEVTAMLPPALLRPNFQALSRFLDWCRESGVEVAVSHPNMIWFAEYEDTLFKRNMAMIDDFYRKAKVTLLDTPRETMYDRELFFDTRYHPDSVGAEIRTRELARRLEPLVRARSDWIPTKAAPEPPHALAKLSHQFSGWSPATGFRQVEGPYPEKSLPMLIWGFGQKASANAWSEVEGRGQVAMTVRPFEAGQALRVRVNGELRRELALDELASRDFTFDATFRPGVNHVEFESPGRPAAALALLFTRLQVSPPKAPASPPPPPAPRTLSR